MGLGDPCMPSCWGAERDVQTSRPVHSAQLAPASHPFATSWGSGGGVSVPTRPSKAAGQGATRSHCLDVLHSSWSGFLRLQPPGGGLDGSREGRPWLPGPSLAPGAVLPSTSHAPEASAWLPCTGLAESSCCSGPQSRASCAGGLSLGDGEAVIQVKDCWGTATAPCRRAEFPSLSTRGRRPPA